MTTKERDLLIAEKSSLEQMLQRLPETAAIDRMSLEARKARVESALAAVPAHAGASASARLTFRGRPVVGSQGIFAAFGATAVKLFSDVVAAIGISKEGTALGTRGALPGRDNYQLLITGTAVGSFGFELEALPEAAKLFPDDAALVEGAIEQTREIMEATIGNDEELTEALADADPRAIEALHGFFKAMADQEAWCALEFKNEVFRFQNVEQVRRSEIRLRRDNIHEESKQLSGRFLGFLPKQRTFEFEVTGTEEIIRGKVLPEIENEDNINSSLGSPVEINVVSKRAGEGKPRYNLISYKKIE